MATYSELLKQIESLKQQAESVRKAELDKVIAEIREKMDKYGLTAADLGGNKNGRARKGTGAKVAAKYRNATTGETWSGRGRTPKWLADAEAVGKKRESFAV